MAWQGHAGKKYTCVLIFASIDDGWESFSDSISKGVGEVADFLSTVSTKAMWSMTFIFGAMLVVVEHGVEWDWK